MAIVVEKIKKNKINNIKMYSYQEEPKTVFDYLGLDDFRTENKAFLTEQIITYLGNKRALLDFIGTGINEIKNELKKEKIDCIDVFSGSGIVSRYLKKFANNLYVNDMEDYCYTINKCYLKNKSEVDFDTLNKYYSDLVNYVPNNLKAGFITEMYSPEDDNNIKKGERVFYTSRNAKYFVCFGDGCDFSDKQTIIDRVKIIAMFGKINKTYINNVKSNNLYYNRGSYYFRVKNWTEREMFDIMYDISVRSVFYYFSMYGNRVFIK